MVRGKVVIQVCMWCEYGGGGREETILDCVEAILTITKAMVICPIKAH